MAGKWMAARFLVCLDSRGWEGDNDVAKLPHFFGESGESCYFCPIAWTNGFMKVRGRGEAKL